MHTAKFISTALAAALATANVAWAQGDPQTLRQAEGNAFIGGDQARSPSGPRHDSRDHRNDRGSDYRGSDHRGSEYRGSYQRDHRDDRRDSHWSGSRDDWRGRGAGPDHDFYRGGRLPPQYRSHQYVVDDWRGHHLHRPPPGYHWVQTGGDYVLAAIATGVITSIILNAAMNH